MIYPGMTAVFAAIIILFFIKSLFFLSGNVDKVFLNNEAEMQNEIPRFNAVDYELIKKRFGWLPGTASSSMPNQPPIISWCKTGTSSSPGFLGRWIT